MFHIISKQGRFIIFLFTLIANRCYSFTAQRPPACFGGNELFLRNNPNVLSMAMNDDLASPVDGLLDNIKMRIRVFQESQGAGYDLKVTVANVIAGDYDKDTIGKEIDELIQSAPCVMFTWENSPSCKSALKAFEMVGNVDVKNVRLDDPWEKGNPLRAELGKRLGRSSVPIIFIGGEYVGGYDGGTSSAAPGMLELAFKGTLRPKLEAAGALK